MAKSQSRPARWGEACTQAKQALEALVDLQGEYSEWKDNLPENLQSGPLVEKLEAVCDLDLDGAIQTVEEAEGLDLPRGFGKD